MNTPTTPTPRLAKVDTVIARYYAAFKAANKRPCDFKIVPKGGYFYRQSNLDGRLDREPWHGLRQLEVCANALEQRARAKLTTFDTAAEVEAAIAWAKVREENGNHLNLVERKNIVGGVRVFFPQFDVTSMPLNEAFEHVVFNGIFE